MRPGRGTIAAQHACLTPSPFLPPTGRLWFVAPKPAPEDRMFDTKRTRLFTQPPQMAEDPIQWLRLARPVPMP